MIEVSNWASIGDMVRTSKGHAYVVEFIPNPSTGDRYKVQPLEDYLEDEKRERAQHGGD